MSRTQADLAQHQVHVAGLLREHRAVEDKTEPQTHEILFLSA